MSPCSFITTANLIGTAKDNSYNISSTCHCNDCEVDVCIGTGGDANLAYHVNSKKHLHNVLRKSKKPTTQCPLDSFFKASAPHTVKFPSAPLLVSSSTSESAVDLTASDSNLPILTNAPCNDIIAQLKAAAMSLPTTVNEATAEDVLAQFSISPVEQFQGADKVWEAIDGVLNPVIGVNLNLWPSSLGCKQ